MTSVWSAWAAESGAEDLSARCHYRGSLVDGVCDCADYWLGATCDQYLSEVVGRRLLFGLYGLWMAIFLGLLVAAVAVAAWAWPHLRRLARVALFCVGVAAASDTCRQAFATWQDTFELYPCDGLRPTRPYYCRLNDVLYALPLAVLGTAFILLQWSWVRLTAIAKGKVCLARLGVRVVTGIMLALSYVGLALLFAPFDFSPTLFMQGYYLVYALVVTSTYVISGFRVWKMIGRSAEGNALRFTFLLFCESATLIAYLLTSLTLVFGDFQRNPSLYFWGHIVLGNFYRAVVSLWLLLALNPANFDNNSTSTSMLTHSDTAHDEKFNSSELFSSVSRSKDKESISDSTPRKSGETKSSESP